MLAVKLNLESYEYDVHSLVKSFYPEETVKVLTPSTKEETYQSVLEQAGITDEKDIPLVIEIRETGAKISVKSGSGNETDRAEGCNSYSWKYAETEGKFKDGFKRFLYRVLSSELSTELPWGNLTGIRPTKIAYGMLENGCSEEEITTFMKDSHYVSQEKIDLSIDIAKREMALLSDGFLIPIFNKNYTWFKLHSISIFWTRF